MKKLFLIVVTVLLLAACTPKCDMEAYHEVVDPILTDWENAVTLAGQTPRIALAPQISDLQDIQQQFNELELPKCTVDANTSLDQAMDYAILGFLDFMGQADDETINFDFRNYEYYLEQYQDAILVLDEK